MATKKGIRHYSEEERQRLLDQVDAFKSEGLPQYEACEKAGIAIGSYTAWKKKKAPAQSTFDLNTLPPAPNTGKMTVVVMTGEAQDIVPQLQNILGG